MKNILTIARREIWRFTRQFRGGVNPLAVILLLGMLGLSIFTLRETAVLGNGLYRLGVSEQAPPIQDARFSASQVGTTAADALLAVGAIDAYIDGPQVIARQDEKSQYAVGALKRYLAEQELRRIANSYDEAQAFPLRVEIRYLDPEEALDPQTVTAPAAAEETVIPSLMRPTAPFARVITALIYILPVTFISVFFTSSFMDEKINRRLTILLSTPISTLQIILGKMLPYATVALAATALIAVMTGGDVLLALAIFAPAMGFLFAIYLMVPLFYRTFQDITFISMLVTTLTTAYLVFPAMFIGLSDLAFMSPLTLAVKMYDNEPFGWREYLFPSLPMAVVFGLAVFAGTRLLNEEFVMGYRPITRKLAEAIYLVLDPTRPYLSVGFLSLLVIPIVYMLQLVVLVIASNLPLNFMLAATLMAVVLVEEVVKSMGVKVLADNGHVHTWSQVLGLAFLSALGFLVGEKLLLFISVSVVSEAVLSEALFSTGFLLVVPLLAHFFFTALVSVLSIKVRFPYPLALLIATVLHSAYNWVIAGGL